MATIDKVSGVSFTDFLSVDDISSSNIAAIDGVLAPATGALLLDTTYGSGAEAAYSVRKLRSAYTGAAIQVQDAVGGSTYDIGFDVNNNLDTATLLAIAGTTELRVSIWYDQSGNGNDASQPTVINRPIIVSAGGTLVEQENRAAINFPRILTETLYAGTLGGQTSTFFSVFTPDNGNSQWIFNFDSDNTPALRSEGPFSFTDFVDGVSYSGEYKSGDFFERILIRGESFATQTSPEFKFNSRASSFAPSNSGRNHMQEAIIYSSVKSASDNVSIQENIGSYFTKNIPTLDTYTGAQAAYSLRKLRTAYTGSAIQVQDNVGSAAIDVSFDVFGELNTVQLSEYGGSNDVFVVKWYDQSGNGNDAEQTSSSSRPKIYDGTTGVVTENGKPAVQFDGTDDFMLSALQFTNTDKTIEIVYTPQESASYAFGILNVNPITRARFYLQTGSATANFAEGNPSVVNSVSSNQTQQIFYMDWTNSNYEFNFAVNGNTVSSATGNANTPIGVKYMLGALNLANDTPFGSAFGKYQEVIIYDSNESANRTGIESSINTFYDIFTPIKDPLLLNSFPGSAAAYSLRKLGSSYSRSAVLVQDNVGGAPKAIAFDSSNNLDSAELIAYGGINDVFVSVFYDQSGNGNDLIQNSSSVRPKIYDGSTQSVVVNNTKASLSFAAGDFMADTGWNGASTSYIFNVLQSNGGNISPRIGVDVGSFTEYYGLGVSGNNGASSAGITSLSQFSNGVPIGATRGVMWDAMQSQNVLTVSGDFSSWTGGFGLTRSGQKMYELGQEFIIYNADKSSERTGIESNIGNYYGLVLAKLLDAYSGAKAGYSLRLLSNSYTGSAIQVQDNALGSTQDIGFDSNGNLDTAALAAYGGSNDVFVSKWYDQSGNGNDASQNTSSARPKVYDGSTGSVILENGKPAVEFNGSSTYFPISISGLNLNSVTVNTVARSNNNSSNRMQFTLGTDTNVRFWNYFQSGFNRFYYGPVTPTIQYGSADTNQHLFSFIAGSTAGGGTMFRDSVSSGTTLPLKSGAMNTTQMRIGAYHNNGIIWSGTMQEFIVYPVDQTNNRTEIETNVNNYYSIY